MSHYSAFRKEKRTLVNELKEALNETRKSRFLKAFRA